MHLSHVLLAAVVALMCALDATSATSDVALPKPNSALSSAAERTRNDHRFLRKHKLVDVKEEEEERGVGDWFTAKMLLGKLALANNEDKGRIIAGIRDADILASIFKQVETHLKDGFPAFKNGMHLNDFSAMIRASHLDSEEQGLLIAAYSKYWITNHFKG